MSKETQRSDSGSDARANPEARVACVSCREPIRAGAAKCIHCQGAQDWRRHLNLSSSVLALLVAFVSVLTFAVPVFKEALTPAESNVDLSFQAYVSGHFLILASNTGNRPGGIGMSDIVYYTEQEVSNPSATDRALRLPVLPAEATDAFIPPNSSRQLRLKPHFPIRGVADNYLEVGHPVVAARLLVRTIQFDGATGITTIELPWKDIEMALTVELSAEVEAAARRKVEGPKPLDAR